MNVRIQSIEVLPSPEIILTNLPTTPEDVQFIIESRRRVENIMTQTKDMFIVVGPCSIHNPDEALEYARLLCDYRNMQSAYLIMRVYFEKPRTRVGWKGLIYDPYLDSSDKIHDGLIRARKLLLQLVRMRIPVACEFLDVITPQYLSDLVTWGAIGARTCESQIHRQLASGLSMPVAFKNLTSGDWTKCIDSILSAGEKHSFLGADMQGRIAHVETNGNPYCHIVLRGGETPNYFFDNVYELSKVLKKEKILSGIMIDCSHANSYKNYLRQCLVATYSMRMRSNGVNIIALMIESNINEGKQNLNEGKYGVSVTDACISWKSTVELLNLINTAKIVSVSNLDEMRSLLREYDDKINEILNNQYPADIQLKTTEEYHLINVDDEIYNICSNYAINLSLLMCLVSCRLACSERIAYIKFNDNPFDFLNLSNNLWQLVTSLNIEFKVLERYHKNRDFFLRILDLSKHIQVQTIEKIVQNTLIGWAVGNPIRELFRGDLVTFYTNLNVNYIIAPIHNSITGTIEHSYENLLGTVSKNISINAYSNHIIRDDVITIIYMQQKFSMLPLNGRISKLKYNIIFCETPIESVKKSVKQAIVITDEITTLLAYDMDIIPRNVTTYGLFDGLASYFS
jgi:3-deoxy-7-phosphoheptulonate synthase